MYIAMHAYDCRSSCMHRGLWRSMLTKWKWGKRIHVRWSTIIGMFHDLWRYMLTYGDVRDDDACAVIDNHKHASQSTMVHAYIWRVWGMTLQARWLTIISMYGDPASICKHVPLYIAKHAYDCWLLCMHHGLWQSMLSNEAVRDDNTCTLIDNDKHASRYMTVHDGTCICIVISIGHPCLGWLVALQLLHQDLLALLLQVVVHKFPLQCWTEPQIQLIVLKLQGWDSYPSSVPSCLF